MKYSLTFGILFAAAILMGADAATYSILEQSNREELPSRGSGLSHGDPLSAGESNRSHAESTGVAGPDVRRKRASSPGGTHRGWRRIAGLSLDWSHKRTDQEDRQRKCLTHRPTQRRSNCFAP